MVFNGVDTQNNEAEVYARELLDKLQLALTDNALWERTFMLFPDAVLISRADSGRIVRANYEAEFIFGYSRDELLAMTVNDLVPEGVRPQHATWRENYATHPRTRPMGAGQALAFRHKSGREVPCQIMLAALPSEGGMLVQAVIRRQKATSGG